MKGGDRSTLDLRAVAAYGRAGASARVRLYDWIDHLGARADVFDYLGSPNNRPTALVRRPIQALIAELKLRRMPRSDVPLILSREASPLSTGRLEQRILRSASRSSFDFDDAIFLPVRGLRNMTNPQRKTVRSASAADVVIVGNQVLADWASNYVNDVRVIPSCIEPSAYLFKETWDLDPSRGRRIVWLGSPSTEQYVISVRRALALACRMTGARIKLISGPYPNSAMEELLPFVDRIPWSPTTVAKELNSADVAIAPLDDTPFARGKCAYKLLQYAATGLPIVGSPVGANREALERFDGYVAQTEDEWTSALLSAFGESPTRRAQRGHVALESVQEHYSFAAWEDSWREATGLSSEAPI